MMIQNEGGQALFSSRFCEEEENYPAMMGMKMKQGRMAREKDEVVVNENFAERMRWGNEIVGRIVHAEGSTYKVVGVLKDFRTNSFYNEQEPLIVHCYKNFGNCIHVRLKEPFAENLRKLNEESSEAFPDKTVSFRSLEQSMAENYNALRVFRNATLMATIAMFFVMLMGLIGYTADEVRRRSKEIAIPQSEWSRSIRYSGTSVQRCSLCGIAGNSYRQRSIVVRQYDVDGYVCRTRTA